MPKTSKGSAILPGSLSSIGGVSCMKTLAYGIAWIIAALWFWLSVVGNPIEELALIQQARVAQGQIVDAWEDVEDGGEGRVDWYHGVTYTYRLPDGREFKAGAKGSGRLRDDLLDLQRPVPVEVEYLPDRPTVSRIKGNGCESITDWLWRKMGLGLILLALAISPGIALVKNGVREMRYGPLAEHC